MFETEVILIRWNAVCGESRMHGVEPGKSRRLSQRLTGYREQMGSGHKEATAPTRKIRQRQSADGL